MKSKPSQRRPFRSVPRLAARSWLLGGLLLALLGCGAAEPLEADIYHDPLLRPSVVQAEGADAQLLARLDDMPAAGSLQSGGASVQVEAPYPAASGRACRGVGERLACRAENGWEFVPAVLPNAGLTPDLSAAPEVRGSAGDEVAP